ncbi:MAG: phage tail protein [bacterium]
MPSSRRSFLKSAGLATAVVSAIPLALSTPVGAEVGFAAAGPSSRGFAAGKFALELDGKLVGVLAAYQGGNVVADVIEFTSGDALIPRKSLGELHYEEIVVMTGLGMDAVLWEWVGRMVSGDPARKNGAIVMADAEFNVIRRMEFNNALLTEIALPTLDAASKEAAQMTIKFRPESTRLTPGTGKLAGAVAAKQKAWLSSNFRISIGDLPCGRVSKIEALAIKQKVTEYREGGEGTIRLLPGRLEYPNLVLTFAATDGSQWQAFFDDFVLNGNNGNDNELGGTLDFMGADLKSVLARLQFLNLGIFRLAPAEIDPSSSNIQRFQADLYSERNRLFVGGLN